jgi:hypothetical protein
MKLSSSDAKMKRERRTASGVRPSNPLTACSGLRPCPSARWYEEEVWQHTDSKMQECENEKMRERNAILNFERLIDK